jgi:hypothetical protein
VKLLEMLHESGGPGGLLFGGWIPGNTGTIPVRHFLPESGFGNLIRVERWVLVEEGANRLDEWWVCGETVDVDVEQFVQYFLWKINERLPFVR